MCQKLVFQSLDGHVEVDEDCVGKQLGREHGVGELCGEEELEFRIHRGFEVPYFHLDEDVRVETFKELIKPILISQEGASEWHIDFGCF